MTRMSFHASCRSSPPEESRWVSAYVKLGPRPICAVRAARGVMESPSCLRGGARTTSDCGAGTDCAPAAPAIATSAAANVVGRMRLSSTALGAEPPPCGSTTCYRASNQAANQNKAAFALTPNATIQRDTAAYRSAFSGVADGGAGCGDCLGKSIGMFICTPHAHTRLHWGGAGG